MGTYSKKWKYSHVQAKLFHSIVNMQKNCFAVSIEMLQFEGCRLADKHIISVSSKSVKDGWRILWSDMTSP
jgi:hypothetical protein